MYFAVNQGAASDVVGTVKAACDEYSRQWEILSDNEVSLLPVALSRMLPERLIVRLGGEESVSYADVMVGA